MIGDERASAHMMNGTAGHAAVGSDDGAAGSRALAGGRDQDRAGTDEQDQYLTFQIAGETFAVNVQQVREVLDLQRIGKIANAPSLLLGMIDVRGVGIPVIDLKEKLALSAQPTTGDTRILVLEVTQAGRQLVVAALADAVYEVAHLAADSVAPAPEFGQSWDSSFMRGLSRRQGAFVTILDLGQLFKAPDFDFFGQA